MIIFQKNGNLNVPKGLGNVSVSVESGNTDTVNEEKVREIAGQALRDAKAYTNTAVTVASEATLQAAQEYSEVQAQNAVNSAETYTDSAIVANDKDVWMQGYIQIWETYLEDINALFDRVDDILDSDHPERYAGLNVYMSHEGYFNNYVPFKIFRISDDRNTMDLQFTGVIFPHYDKITVIEVTMTRGQMIAESDVKEYHITL